MDAKHEFHFNDVRRSRGGVIGTGGKPVVSFRCDHGTDPFLATFFPLFEARRMPVTLGVITGAIGDPNDPYEPTTTTWAQLKSYVARGIEIWCHSHTHLDPATVGTTMQTEVVDSRALIEANGIRCVGWHNPGIPNVTYPNYSNNFVNPASWDSDYGIAVWENYGVIEMAGTVGGAYRQLPTCGAADMSHITLDSLTLDQAKTAVDNCTRFGVSAQFMFHARFISEGSVPWTVQTMQSFLDYVVTKRDAGQLMVLSASGQHWADPNTSRRLNVVTDGGFEAGVVPVPGGSPWNRGGGSTGSMAIGRDGGHSGSNYLIQPSAVGRSYAYQGYGGIQNLRLGGAIMVAEAWVRCVGSATEASIQVQCDGGASLDLVRYVSIAAGGSWQLLRSVFGIPKSAGSISIRLARRNGSGTLHWDDVGIYPT